jgi:hypothetical protein
VLVDPIKPTLQAPGIKLLKLEFDESPSNVAFNFNCAATSRHSTHTSPPLPPVGTARYCSQHHPTHFTNPRVLSHMASYDVASNRYCSPHHPTHFPNPRVLSYMASYDVASKIFQTRSGGDMGETTQRLLDEAAADKAGGDGIVWPPFIIL